MTGLRAMPRLTTTVPRQYVHRASHAEVFLTGCEKLDEGRFALTGEWPRRHAFFTHTDPARHDALQAAETIRQAGLFLAHAEYDVPLDHQFLLSQLHLTTLPPNMVTGPGPSELSLTATCTDVVRRGKRLAQFHMNITIDRAGRPCAAGGGHFTCISQATYRRLRATTTTATPRARTQPQHTLPPATVGKTAPADVVLSSTGHTSAWLLDPDPRHPILFEHAGDHYPGMVLLEAACQAATALSHPQPFTPTAVKAHFHQYAEFTSPLSIEATPLPAHPTHGPSTRITGTQQNHTVFTTTVTGTRDNPT
ncbi:ScbA/BarX family gamma-butyrolactone biosynthesis protein [Streptomyces sp. NPDC050211]|uniref:ScbA/BarX family gamma-butyrolactone biosynthesis protein n=1 Tax=Streptomyces sp. NPDC050211 TaxID=3154932 RepID=UPI00343F864B